MDVYKAALALHKKKKGKLAVVSKVKVESKRDLSLSYTPGVAGVSIAIAKDKKKVYDYTLKQNTVAVVSDGSKVLGLGNLGAEAALPVMEGKCVLFKELANVDAFPICLRTQDEGEIVNIVKNIAPVFGGINLEDIAAPKCFSVERKLQGIGIPVFHDDQHGTAIVVLAALWNALKVVKKRIGDVSVVISGAGAAGISIAKMLKCVGVSKKFCKPVKDLILVDSDGIINKERKNLNKEKRELARITNKNNLKGSLADAMKNADVFIGVSVGGIVNSTMVKSMNKTAIVSALANPVPEVMPGVARRAGAAVVGTGRSDFANQINNVLAFPGVFRGALDARATKVTMGMKIAAAKALASYVKRIGKSRILPDALDRKAAKVVALAVGKQAIREGVVRR